LTGFQNDFIVDKFRRGLLFIGPPCTVRIL